MKNIENLEWWVMWHNFNADRIDYLNIFHNANLYSKRIGLPKLLKEYENFDKFKEELDMLFRYCYHSKVEYEILVSGLGKNDEEYKLDIYFQIKPNLDKIARYIIEEYNKHKRKKIEVDN